MQYAWRKKMFSCDQDGRNDGFALEAGALVLADQVGIGQEMSACYWFWNADYRYMSAISIKYLATN